MLGRGGQQDQLAWFLSFAGLVVVAGSLNPIPSRTRPLNSPAPMVLSLKTWKSRSLPGLPRTEHLITINNFAELPSAIQEAAAGNRGGFLYFGVALHSSHALAFLVPLA